MANLSGQSPLLQLRRCQREDTSAGFETRSSSAPIRRHLISRCVALVACVGLASQAIGSLHTAGAPRRISSPAFVGITGRASKDPLSSPRKLLVARKGWISEQREKRKKGEDWVHAARDKDASRHKRTMKNYRESPFTKDIDAWRGGARGAGKRSHFHLLDRYIRRIDSLVPEEMEHLVKWIGHKPNLETTTRSLKIQFVEDVKPGTIREDAVRALFAPLVPESVATGWKGPGGSEEVYVQFASNAECREARKAADNKEIQNFLAQPRYIHDDKMRKVLDNLGIGRTDEADEATELKARRSSFDSSDEAPEEWYKEEMDQVVAEGKADRTKLKDAIGAAEEAGSGRGGGGGSSSKKKKRTSFANRN
eukprot:TRINITY_DN4127_c0_g2_i1.p1 TRINITY_DN4127_c0_g2~~TRINITY_DN4127_c0_g2_i1.p1  ORF type:complete len:379 (-),score=54.22 TRINITY_DN4127_c0_g2_i1:399-1496(-)